MDEPTIAQMRELMMITEYYVQADVTPVEQELVESLPPPNVCLVADLKDAIFKMRAFTESEQCDDIGLGMELGMQRAADMIESIIGRYSEENNE